MQTIQDENGGPAAVEEEAGKETEAVALAEEGAAADAEPSPETACPDASGEESPPERIAALEAELAEAKDGLLRKAADFENFRKRMLREKQDAIDFANQSLLQDLIPVIDDFERALKSAEALVPAGDSAGASSGEERDGWRGFLEGIGLIEKRLKSLLENRWGLKQFDSAGEPFDPNRHEAIMMEKSPDVGEPVVAEDFLKGYTLKDRVIRSAKVKVTMPE